LGREFDITGAQYGEILDIPGYTLRKPIEVAILEERDGEKRVGYTATHVLPTDIGDGKLLSGVHVTAKGKTEGDAAKALIQELIDRFESPKSEIENQYLRNIMVPG
jgi:hypothetical protein